MITPLAPDSSSRYIHMIKTCNMNGINDLLVNEELKSSDLGLRMFEASNLVGFSLFLLSLSKSPTTPSQVP